MTANTQSHSGSGAVALLALVMTLVFGVAYGMPSLPPELHEALVAAPSLGAEIADTSACAFRSVP
ncbi:MAG: hypothetical protein ACT4P4_02435 [Betaproteobacteria bacterium]